MRSHPGRFSHRLLQLFSAEDSYGRDTSFTDDIS